MSELLTLQKRIDDSTVMGVETALVRDDYEPAGELMMLNLCQTGRYVQRQERQHRGAPVWKIFRVGFEPV